MHIQGHKAEEPKCAKALDELPNPEPKRAVVKAAARDASFQNRKYLNEAAQAAFVGVASPRQADAPNLHRLPF